MNDPCNCNKVMQVRVVREFKVVSEQVMCIAVDPYIGSINDQIQVRVLEQDPLGSIFVGSPEVINTRWEII